MKSIQVGPVSVSIKVTDDESELSDLHREACYTIPEGAIYIDEELAQDKRFLALMHELGHAVFDVYGIQSDLATTFKLSPSKIDVLEETIMLRFIPAYIDVLVRAGWLKPPRVI